MNKFVISAALLFSFSSTATVDLLSNNGNHWVEGQDSAVVQILGASPGSDNLFYIRKTFMNRGWEKEFPAKSKIEQYDIVEAYSGKSRPLRTGHRDDKIKIGKVSWNGLQFIIPITSAENHISIELFDPKQSFLETAIKTRHTKGSLSDVIALPKGYLSSYGQGAYSFVDFTPFSGGKPTKVPLNPNSTEGYPVFDIYARNSTVYIFAKGKQVNGTSPIRISSFDASSPIKVLGYEKVTPSQKGFFNAELIPSLGPTPYLWTTAKKQFMSPANIGIARITSPAKMLWQNQMQTLEWRKFAIVGLCDGHFMISKISNVPGKTKSVSFEQFNANGKPTSPSPQKDVLKDKGIITDFDFYPTDKGLYTVMTYEKREAKPRNGGTYYWTGYKIKRMKIDTNCAR